MSVVCDCWLMRPVLPPGYDYGPNGEIMSAREIEELCDSIMNPPDDAPGTVHYLREDQCNRVSEGAQMACGISYLRPGDPTRHWERVRSWERLDGRKWNNDQSRIICCKCWDAMTEAEKETFNKRNSAEYVGKGEYEKKDDDSCKD